MDKSKNYKIIIIHCVLILAALLITFGIIKEKRFDAFEHSFISEDIAKGGKYDKFYYLEEKTAPLTQRFEATTDILWGLGLDFERNQEYPEGSLEILVTDEAGTNLYQAAVPISSIENNKKYWVVFSNIVEDSKGKIFNVSLSVSEMHEEDRLKVFLDKNSQLVNSKLQDSTGELEGNIKLGQMYSQSVYVKKLVYCFMAIVAVMIYGLYFGLFIKRCKIETVFLILMAILGLTYAVLMGPGNIPDETSHYKTAYAYSNLMMGRGELGQVPIEMTKSDYSFYRNMSKLPANPERYEEFCRGFLRKSDATETVILDEYPIESASPYLYVGQAMGITIGRIIGFNGLTNFYLGRMFNALVFALLAFWAMKKLPCYKMMLFTLCLFPMTTQLAGSLSYDSTILGIALVLFAYIVALVRDKDKAVEKKELIVVAIASILLAACKGGAYSPLLGLLFLIPAKRFVDKKWRLLYMGGILLASVLLFYFTSVSAIASSTGSGTAGWSGQPHYTIGWVFEEPLEFLALIANTIFTHGWSIITGIVGEALGALNLMIPFVIIFGFMLIFVFTILFVTDEKGFDPFSKKQKVVVGVVSVLVIAIVAAAMLFSWTPKGAPTIEGIQGRYFLPIMLPLGFCLKKHVLKLKKPLDDKLIFGLGWLQMLTIVSVLMVTLIV